ncbi:hypothetical protein Ssi03_59960 [Sphaerisporangium siamense]|uniref:Very-short-patch-repair endonuclease n=1 Tax=Sphaerisporangium siamense TaxID=795645 RepID=A0A7W7DAF0_9ACTN|nr:DUF559 domain-containing protein [Sphaerisporangium siamense]MBB4703229.1 very-short-patch-repair endonuclease [Sphaerisporangium siamense]GII88006.1 hypothetical protein Ssi03_59960 [Sphaerisporangium siamense]
MARSWAESPGEVAHSWAELPADRVVLLAGAGAAAHALTAEPPPDAAPAILTCVPVVARSVAEAAGHMLDALQDAALDLFPAWLPDAAGIQAGAAGTLAVRALALRTAATSPHFGPFLAALAESALHHTDGTPRRTASGGPPDARSGGFPGARSGTGAFARTSRFGPEVRAAGLARVLAAGFQRSGTALLVPVPEDFSRADQDVLLAAAEWLAARGGFGVWLTGALSAPADRVTHVTLRLPSPTSADPGLSPPSTLPPRAVTFPAVTGMPHPASHAEKALERALAARPWSHGRAWNQTYRSGPLANPIRVDLIWRRERCIVEIDGEDHHRPDRYAADRLRDVQLQLDGYAVLRFTNAQVLMDVEAVAARLERYLTTRRDTLAKGSPRV